MHRPLKAHRRQTGFSMIEVMVSLVVLLVGLLGLVGLIVVSQRAESESYQRSQALLLLQDMVGRINANRRVAACYAITTDTLNGRPYLGNGSTVTPACGFGTAQANTLATGDLTVWSNLLTGTAESQSGANLGAMVGARGCVSFDTSAGNYLVSVAWQGIAATVAPADRFTCGKGQYGNEALRRVVTLTMKISNLN
ncbi:MAG: type IV pilus modification protein PilV [Candidatus Saccharibacteria bacterium]|nr:type IV pilus modification protein PilV [Rhodoferax sp.]